MNTSNTCILVTRPRAESLQIQKDLNAKGYRVIQAPLLTIKPFLQKPLEGELPATIQGWIFSSSNGVLHTKRVFSHHPLFSSIWSHQSAIAVGPTTAQALKTSGFSRVIVAQPHNSDGLFQAAIDTFEPDRGTVIHPGNLHAIGRIVERLQQKNLDARHIPLYHTQSLPALPSHVIRAFRDHTLTHIMLFSIQTAQTLLQLVKKHEISHLLSYCSCLCLSHAIKDIVQELPWKEHAVAKNPLYHDMCELLPKF
jgi:uroporphyrinogen-III synthase